MSVEAVVGVVEGLVEVVHAKQKLVGHARSDDGIQSGRVVVYVDRRLLEIVFQVGTRGRQRRAGAQRCRLATLPTEPSEREGMPLSEVEIALGHSVVAVAGGGIGTEEVVGSSRSAIDAAGPKRGHQVRGDFIFGNGTVRAKSVASVGQNREGIILVGG